MNILITGANGFVGKILTNKLLGKGDNLFLVSRDKKFKVAGAKIFYGDLIDRDFCKKIVSGIDIVFYLAGYKKNIAYHTKYPSDFILGNIEPLVSFLKVVKESSIKKIIYLSSISVGLYKEGEEDGYVVGKYINELILKSFSKQFDIDIKIVRAPGIYGPGDNFDPETANFIPSMVNKIYKSTKEISVWGNGKRKMQFIFIDDLVSNLVAISQSPKKFFVVGNQEDLTINDIVERIVKLSGRHLIINNDPTKSNKPTQLFQFKNEKKLQFDFDKGLKKTISYFKTINKI
jgi:GDP-L-fucose synthase